MNIGIDIREICVSNTGIGQYTRNLLNYLITKKSEHYNFFLYTNTGELNEFQKELPENFKFIKYKTTNTIFDFYALPKLIKKNKIDLFFSPYYKFPYLAQCPCVITVHDIGFITFPIQYYARSRFYRLFASRLLEYSLNRSARIFAVSNFTKSEILENYNIPSEKISVLYNTTNKIFDISLKTIEKNKIENLRKQYGRFILSVSNYKPHKNINGLINVFSKICKDIPENLLLAGPINDGMTSAKELVKKLNIENRVFFITPKNNNELAVLYAAAEIYCHPSMYEGFGIPPIEAQKCGCPVISSNAASLSEILEDSAILFDYRNFDEFVEKLKELATDENLKKLIIAKGLKNSERFNAQKIYPKFFEVIDNFK